MNEFDERISVLHQDKTNKCFENNVSATMFRHFIFCLQIIFAFDCYWNQFSFHYIDSTSQMFIFFESANDTFGCYWMNFYSITFHYIVSKMLHWLKHSKCLLLLRVHSLSSKNAWMCECVNVWIISSRRYWNK